MKTFPVEARAADHEALVRVSDRGHYVFAVVLRSDHSKLIAGGGLDGELTSLDDLLEASRDVIDWPRCETELRAMQDEARSRRFDHEERRLLGRL